MFAPQHESGPTTTRRRRKAAAASEPPGIGSEHLPLTANGRANPQVGPRATDHCRTRGYTVSLTERGHTFAGPGEIKRREVVVLDPQVSPEEIKSREVELGSESWTFFASVVPQQLCYGHCPCDCSAQQLKQQLRGILVAAQWRGDTAITFWLFWRRSTSSSVFRVGARGRAFTLSPPFPLSTSLISHLASVDVKQKCLLNLGITQNTVQPEAILFH